MQYGIAISTYIGPSASPNRTNIFLASIHSLLASGFDGKIVIVDDASISSNHLNKLYDVTDRIKYIKRTENVGLSQCKNECIKALSDCEYVFLADDDMLYNGNWWAPYIDASKKTGIEHFCYYVPQVYHNPPASIVEHRGVKLTKYTECNGCLLMLTKRAITKVGIFQESNKKGWVEHPNYSKRCVVAGFAPFLCDMYGSRNNLRLNRSSYDCTSAATKPPAPAVAAAPAPSREQITASYNDLYLKADYDNPTITWNQKKWTTLWNAICLAGNNHEIIDLGCGRGYYLRVLKAIGHSVFGVEQSKACCEMYLQDIPHKQTTVQSFLADAKTKHFVKKWNVVMSTDMLEHIPESDLDGVVSDTSKIAKTAIHGITNSSDKSPLSLEELHLSQHDCAWWVNLFKKHYTSVEIVPDKIEYPTPYFVLLCKK